MASDSTTSMMGGPPASTASRRTGLGSFTRAESFALLVPVLLCVLLALHRLAQPNALTGVFGYTGWGYDDGVHLGTAIRLAEFSLPYRDYVLLHPPGIAVVLAPLGILARLTSSTDAFALGRILIACVGIANVVLVALLARRRGPLAMLVGGVALAVWPLAPDALRTIMVEPLVVLFVLLGTMALFPVSGLASSKRLFWAGSLFGVAVSLRLLSLLPLVAALLVVCWTWRRTLKPFLLGLLASLGVLVLPFFLLAPSNFIQQVITSQLSRPTSNVATTSAGSRLAMVIGLSPSPSETQAMWAVVITVAFAALVAVTFFWRRRSTGPLDWFALLGSAFMLFGVLRAPEAFWHYMYVATALLALLAALTLGLIADGLPDSRGVGTSWRWVIGFVVAVTVILGGVALIPHDMAFATSYEEASDPREWVQGVVPAGACVVSDVSSMLISSDRLIAESPSCPDTLDPYGAWLTTGAHRPPSQVSIPPADLAESWRSDLESIDYVVLSADQSIFFPWNAESRSYFARNFRLVDSRGRLVIYERVG